MIYVGMEPDQYKASDALTPSISAIHKFTAEFFHWAQGQVLCLLITSKCFYDPVHFIIAKKK